MNPKLRALAEGVQVLTIKEGYRWAIPCKSNPGYAYEITQEGDQLYICNCKAGQNGSPCKHVGAVMLWEETRKHVGTVKIWEQTWKKEEKR